ncbi:translocation/assembly module TamB domain-containing protein [Aquimarina latercula]|uniref:translocation/assembly module TamB domain-containing protein n=1 Tax=Aquimarina latercula TaxID=987 RepID=UPI000487AC6F|nr:translocation/assembly module TamB [Aquimarina latercula]
MTISKKKKKYRILSVLKKITVGLFLFFITLVLFIRSPWGQDLIISKATAYISGKTKTKVEIEKLYTSFSGNILLKGLYLEDQKGDTLLYTNHLEASVGLLSLIRGEEINIKSLDWDGLTARVYRNDTITDYNFNFLIETFSEEDTKVSTVSSDTPNISLGRINFTNFDIRFKDSVLGIESSLKLNDFSLKTNEIDLERMLFDIEEIELSNSKVDFKQTKSPPESADKEATSLPILKIETFKIKNTTASYNSLPEDLEFKVTIGDFSLEAPILNLAEQNIELQNLILADSDIHLKSITSKMDTNSSTTSKIFEWPQWNIKAKNIALSNTNITAKTGNIPSKKGVFNPDQVALQKLGLTIKDVSYTSGQVNAAIENITFYERSGFYLETLSAHIDINKTSFSLTKLKLLTNSNRLIGAIQLKYNTIDSLLKKPEQSQIVVSIPDFVINPKDAYYFQPALKKNVYIDALTQKDLTGTLQLKGILGDLEIPKTNLKWGASTTVFIDGKIKNLPKTDTLELEVDQFDFRSAREDVLAFVKEEDLDISIPETIQLQGKLTGNANDFAANATLKIPEGSITIDGKFKNISHIGFDGNIDVQNLQLGKILTNDKLGTYSFTTELNAKGKNLNTLDGKLTTNFRKLEFNSYDFASLKLSGNIQNGKGTVDLNFKDEHLDFEMVTNVELDSVSSKTHSTLNVKGVNFKALGLTEEDIRTKFNFISNFQGNLSEFKFDGALTEAIAVKNKKPYILGDIFLNADISKDTTAVSIQSNPLEATLLSNTDPSKLISELQQQFNQYLEKPQISTIADSTAIFATKLKLKATLRQAPILKDLFLPQLDRLDPVIMTVGFNGGDSTLNVNVTAPYIEYNGSKMENLSAILDTEKEKLIFDFGLNSLSTGVIDVAQIQWKGNLKDNILQTDFSAFDKDETLFHIASEIQKEKDTIVFHIHPSDLIINKQNWTIPVKNSIRFAKDFLSFNDFVLSQNGQEILVSTTFPEKTMEHIGFGFTNFKIATIASLFNSEKLLASGTLNGGIIIENPFQDKGITADATVSDLQAMEVPLGKLSLKAKSINATTYGLNLGVTGKNINLTIDGDYKASTTESALDFDIDLQSLQLKPLEEWSSTYISKTSGSLAGNVKVTGTIQEPKFDGAVHFNDSRLTINALNAAFVMPEESIRLDNKGVYFDTFTLLDGNKNPFILDGSILTRDIANPSFKLSLKAKKIQILNSTKKDNSLFYGKVNLDADVAIGGDLKLPKISGTLLVNKDSDFTYSIPEDEVDIVEKEGIVLFVNKKNPDDILTKQEEDFSSSAVLKGYDINAQLSVDKKAVFNIVVDERTGDNLRISGGGDLNFGIAPNGNMSLSGKYEVNSGHYEVSLYNLVKRRFEIAQGSSIVWRGNPLEADMDIRAIYKIETAATGLMANQISNQTSTVAGKYRQKLPFLVYLNLNGELLKPEISFNLDIPKDKQGELGGAVYSQVQQLNTQEEELNKQVFSLLVLNQFFPSSSNDGSSGGSLSIARDNVNNVLSDQLNNFSNKLLGNSGVELDFGIDSYTDYKGNAPQNKTQLDVNARKRLFNNKLIVEVGSGVDIQENSQNAGQATPLVGTINIQYLFDENGKWRVKGYRKNTFESIIDGQVIITGISLIFNQEFNQFKELFAKAVQEEIKNNLQKESKTKEKSEQ